MRGRLFGNYELMWSRRGFGTLEEVFRFFNKMKLPRIDWWESVEGCLKKFSSKEGKRWSA